MERTYGFFPGGHQGKSEGSCAAVQDSTDLRLDMHDPVHARFIGVIVYGGWDGVQRGYTFGQFLVRFLIILFGVKAFDIIGLDYILITKTQFFQHYFPETEGCAGYHNFGFNRKEQIKQSIMMPFAALVTAWICSLF